MKAFSLIEIIVTIDIIILFSVLTIPRYYKYSQQNKLKQQTTELAETLELAKKKAGVSELYNPACSDFRGYRITIASNSYSLNFGCGGTYEAIQQYDLASNTSVITGTGNFDFPRAGFGINISQGTIRLKDSYINECLDISITPLGIITVGESFFGC